MAMAAASVAEREEWSAATASALDAYEALLQRWGRRYNLVSRRDLGRFRQRHIDDSLALLPWCRGNVVDVGSGAGLPGVPLAIARRDMPVTLLERSERKCAFLRHVVLELGLDNVAVVQADARRHRPKTGFETAVARAVAPPPASWRLARPLLVPSGTALVPTSAPVATGFESGEVVGSHRAGCGWVLLIRVSPERGSA